MYKHLGLWNKEQPSTSLPSLFHLLESLYVDDVLIFDGSEVQRLELRKLHLPKR